MFPTIFRFFKVSGWIIGVGLENFRYISKIFNLFSCECTCTLFLANPLASLKPIDLDSKAKGR